MRYLDCPYRSACGGCGDQNLPYEKTLERKQEEVRRLLAPYCRTERIVGMEEPYAYRNKVHAAVGWDRRGEMITGIYARNTHRIIPVTRCRIHDTRADETVQIIRSLAQEFGIEPFDEDRGTGLLRHILIRAARSSGQMMAVLVIGRSAFPNRSAFVEALCKRCPWVRTVAVNLNGQHTSMILGPSTRTVFGPGFIEDELMGLRFALGPDSFYQVNPLQTEKLYGKAIDLCRLNGKETLLDAYCGIGTIGLCAASKCAKVIGVELNANAVRDAQHNAKRNGIGNAVFIASDAGEWMNKAGRAQTVDVAVMDPPRTGSSRAFLASLCRKGPERVVYVSCNPVTLARDLAFLTREGYHAETAVPFDMFPWTEHVETVCLLRWRKKDLFPVP